MVALTQAELLAVAGGTDWRGVRQAAVLGAVSGIGPGAIAGTGFGSVFGVGVGAIPGAVIGGVAGAAAGAATGVTAALGFQKWVDPEITRSLNERHR